ncbi:MAG: hypothetical protein LBW85_03005 [Deltaproteobacteria bacterium]|jgi:hypothetical protein|nr:hypothetical protein [Deltaproteobacteria bacterium]
MTPKPENRHLAALKAHLPLLARALLPAALLPLLAAAPEAAAQVPNTVVVYQDAELQGIFCQFEESESGDNPPWISLANDKGQQSLSVLAENEQDYNVFTALTPGTPVIYALKVIYLYDESGGGMFTYVGPSKIRKDSARAADASACRPAGN